MCGAQAPPHDALGADHDVVEAQRARHIVDPLDGTSRIDERAEEHVARDARAAVEVGEPRYVTTSFVARGMGISFPTMGIPPPIAVGSAAALMRPAR